MPHEDHEKNRAAWNRMVDLHVNHLEYRTQEVIDGGSSLKRIELEALGDVRGKRLLHLMCQFGLDTLSWARQGALVTGVDISDRSIQVANELKVQCGLHAEFVRSDVLDLTGLIDRNFDIVFQSYGTHIWVSDMFKWAKVVSHYLKPGGVFFMIDEHPINPLFLFPGPEIVNALISAGLTIERLDEYNYGYYKLGAGWYKLDEHYYCPSGGPTKYPLMLAVKAQRPRE
jgi:2-polyprenyl-3-methyl-5-hydroxy-6-metoxy-1,4-benzoquinol methylase